MTDPDLIARLEAATEGNWLLDSEIAATISGRLDQDWKDPRWHDGGPRYTTSLDAKLPGENITAMAWFEVVPGEALGEVCEAWHEDRKSGLRTMGAGKTEPLARRIAALRAQAEQPTEETA